MSACGRDLHYCYGEGHVEAYYVRCKSWSCEACWPFKLAKLRAEIAEGEPNKLLTLTCNPAKWETPAQAALGMTDALEPFFRKCAAYLKVKRINRFVVVEQTKRGWPHFHIALRCGFIPQAKFKEWWNDHTGASIVDVRRIKSQRGVARYLAKYLSKSPHAYVSTLRDGDDLATRKLKRYWRSRDWKVGEKARETPSFKIADHRILRFAGLAALELALRGDGWQIIKASREGLLAVEPRQGAPPPLWDCTTDLPSFRQKFTVRALDQAA